MAAVIRIVSSVPLKTNQAVSIVHEALREIRVDENEGELVTPFHKMDQAYIRYEVKVDDFKWFHVKAIKSLTKDDIWILIDLSDDTEVTGDGRSVSKM